MAIKKTGRVLKDFNDAGTEKSFTAGTTIEFTEGEFLNYAAAGLVAEPDATDDASA